MTTMVAELYDALRDAGASDEKARQAAEALANYDNRFDKIERRLDALDHKLDLSVAALERKIDDTVAPLKSDVVLLKWMVGAVFGFLITIVLKLFLH